MRDEWIDLYRRTIAPELIGLVPASVARQYRVIPVAWERGLVVAMIYPDDNTLEALRFILNSEVVPVLASPHAIDFSLARYYPNP